MTEYLAYELPPPTDVSAAVQALVAACHHWPRTNVRELEPISVEGAQAQTACALAENEFSSAPALWSGAGVGIAGLIVAFVAWRFARAVVRWLFPGFHHAV